MKQSFFSLFLLLCFFAPIRANDTISISQTMAIQAISSLYVGQNVDLYIGEGIISVYPGPGGGSIGPLGLEQTGPNSIDLPRLNYPTTHWVVYVDKEPTKNGLHNNMYYWIKKKIVLENGVLDSIPYNTNVGSGTIVNITPAIVSNRYGNNANSKPLLSGAATPNNISSHTYAVILHAVNQKMQSYERYWNDCSYIYQVLTKKYGVPKQNIYTFMDDGANGSQYIKADGSEFASLSHDIDFDGNDETFYSAKFATFKNKLLALSNTLTTDDHLFVFIVGNSNVQANTIQMSSGNISAFSLNSSLNSFNVKDINVVLSFNGAAQFASYLQGNNRVITASCASNEAEWSRTGIPFSEFVYYWTSAINQEDVYGNAIPSDTNQDGTISMAEAFAYANSQMRSDEHPSIYSNSSLLANLLTFSGSSKGLYIRDNTNDVGDEPNLTTSDYTHSPDVQILLGDIPVTQMGIEDDYWYSSTPITPLEGRIRILKKGSQSYNGGKYLALYWRCPSYDTDAERWHLNTHWGVNSIPSSITTNNYMYYSLYNDSLFNFIKASGVGTMHTMYVVAQIVDTPDDVPLVIDNVNMTSIVADSKTFAMGTFGVFYTMTTGNRISRVSSLPPLGILVGLNEPAGKNTKIILTSTMNSTYSTSVDVPEGVSEVLIPTNSRRKDVYAITLIENNLTVDSKSVVLE